MNSPFQRIEADLAVSITDLKRNPNASFDVAKGQAVAVLNHNRVVGYIISPEAYEGFLEAVEDLQDIADIQRNKDDDIIPVELNDL